MLLKIGKSVSAALHAAFSTAACAGSARLAKKFSSAYDVAYHCTFGRKFMNKRDSKRTFRACVAGIANQAVVVNVTALLFAPFMRLYGFTYVQLGFLAAAGFAAQMAADILLLFLIDRAPSSALAALAAAMSCAGLVFYGCVPCLFAGA